MGVALKARSFRCGYLVMALHVRTTLLNSQPLTERVGLPVSLKMDSEQNSGSFKLRGIGLLCSRVNTISMVIRGGVTCDMFLL